MGVPAATCAFSASPAGWTCSFPPRRLRDSGNPPAQRRSRPGGGITTGPSGRSGLLEERPSRALCPSLRAGDRSLQGRLSSRGPTAQETSILTWKLVRKAGLRTPLQTPWIRNSGVQPQSLLSSSVWTEIWVPELRGKGLGLGTLQLLLAVLLLMDSFCYHELISVLSVKTPRLPRPTATSPVFLFLHFCGRRMQTKLACFPTVSL